MHRNHFGQKLCALLVIAAIIGGLWFLFTSREVQRTDNPLEERSTDSAQMYQTEQVDLSVNHGDFASLSTGGSGSQDPEPEKNTPSDLQEDTDTDPDKAEEPRILPDQDPENTEPQTENSLFVPSDEEYIPSEQTPVEISSGSTELTGGTDISSDQSDRNSSGGDEDLPPLQPSDTTSDNRTDLLPPADVPGGADGTGDSLRDTDLIYFTTNIINGSTVSTRELNVAVTHKISYLIPLSTLIELNGVPASPDGTLLLEEGRNTITVTVVYADQEEHQIRVSRTYTVYLELEQVVITTDLSDRTVNQRNFSFTAYASAGGQRVPLSVSVNGTEAFPSGNRYQTQLNEGDNVILLAAAAGQSQAQFTAHIFVDLPDQMEITTDLYDHEVDDPNFVFYAALSGGTDRAALTVVANGETLVGDHGSYRYVLARGNNFIRLKASDVDGAEYTMEFVISYHNYVVKESYEADGTMPTIYTNLKDGMTLDSSIYSLQVKGTDRYGERIYGDHLTVELNGMTLEDRNEDGSATYYQLDLTAGPNSVVITVWDYEDRYTIYRYSVYCNDVPEGERIGTITVSVSASTVGLGYLIPPTQVDIYQGQNLVVPVATVLELSGYEYQYSGSLENGFYLRHIIREGITDGYHIPEDLEDAINQDGLLWTNQYYTNSLGEFDFTQGSGWMYTLNGSGMPGMSDVYPSDGDVVELRYTLAYGRDLGLGIGSDGKNYNYFREW